ncbi:MAG: 6-bladed beta-propeller [Gemmatimonadota bacterium]|nr:6-bladed beta-propeller [Gemmatimonadota bacterium]
MQTTIGQLDGDHAEVFARVRTIEVDGAGNVYVLDGQTSDIHVFNRNGSHVTSYRHSGKGPRELLGIRGSDLDSEGILHVADAGNGRISTFELDGDSLAFKTVTTLRFRPEDVCVLGGRRYVLHQPGPSSEPTISEIDGDGQVIRRFASPEEPQGARQRRELGRAPHMLNWGYVACDEATRTIVKFNWLVPIVRAFGPEGEVRWQTTLDDYVPWQLWPNRRGQCCRYRPNPDEGFSHSGRAVVTDRNGHVLLGLQIEGPRSAENRRHELLVLDISSGRVIDRYRTSGAVGAVGNGLIFTYAEDPFPQLRVFATR